MTDQLRLKRIAAYTAAVLGTLAVLFVLYRLKEVVLLFAFSLLLAAALRKNILWLEAHRVPRSLAIVLWYVLVLGVIIGLGVLMAAPFQAELDEASNRLPTVYDAWLSRWQTGATDWQHTLARRLPTTGALFGAVGNTEPRALGNAVLGITYSVLNIGISVVAILSLTYYWLADQERFERLWLTLLPVQQRSIARTTWRDTERQVGAFVRSEAVQFVATIVILWAAFGAMNLPYPTIFALYAGFAQLIPWIGIPLTLMPLALYILGAPLEMIFVAGGVIIAVGLIMDRVVEPFFSQGSAAHPILVVVGLLVMADSAGLAGMIIALPLAAALQIIAAAVVRANSVARDTTPSQEAAQIQEFRTRAVRLESRIPDDPEQRRAMEGLLARLEGLLGKTESLVQERSSVLERERSAKRQKPTIATIFQRRP